MKTKFHPGKYVREALESSHTTAEEMSAKAGLDLKYLKALLNEQTSINEDAAEKIGAFFDISPQMWVNLQNTYDSKNNN